MPSDQLRLDVTVQGAAPAQAALDALDARLRSMPQTAQVASAAAQQTGAAWQRSATETVAGWDRAAAAMEARQERASARITSAVNRAADAQNQAAIRVSETAQRELDRQVAAAERAAQQRSQLEGRGNILLGGAATAEALALTAALEQSIAAAAQFQRTFTDVDVVLRPTAEGLAELQQRAIQLGAATQFSSQQVAQGFYELASAGLNEREVLAAIEPAIQAATLGHQQLGQTTQTVASIMRQFGFAAADLPRIIDVQTVAVRNSLLHWSELDEAYRNIQGTARFMGVSFEDATAALEVMRNAGTTATQAGTSLRTFLDRVSKQSGEAGAAIREMGLHIFDAQGQFVGLVPILQQIEAATAHMTEADRDRVVAMLAGGRASALLRDTLVAQKDVEIDGQQVTLHGSEVLQYFADQNRNAAGAAAAANAEIAKTLSFQWQTFTASVQEGAIRLGQQFVPAATLAAGSLRDLVNQFVNAPPATQQTVAALAGLALGATALTGAVLTAAGAWALLGPAIGAALVAAAPFLLTIGAITAASAVAATAWLNDWGHIRETTETAGVAIGEQAEATRVSLDNLGAWLHSQGVPGWDDYWRHARGGGAAQAAAAPAPGQPPPPPPPEQQQPFGQQSALELLAGHSYAELGATAATAFRTALARDLLQPYGLQAGDLFDALGIGVGSLNQAIQQEGAAARVTWEQEASGLINAAILTGQRVGEGLATGLQQGVPQDAGIDQVTFDRVAAQLATQGRDLSQETVDGLRNGLAEQLGADPLGPLIDEFAGQLRTLMHEEVGGALADPATAREALSAWEASVRDALAQAFPGLGIAFREAILNAIHTAAAQPMAEAGTEGADAFVAATEQGLAPLPTRVALILENIKRVAKESGLVTGYDFAAGIAAALKTGDVEAAESLVTLDRAIKFYQQTLGQVTPAQAIWLEKIRLTSGEQAALDAAVTAGLVPLAAYQAAVQGATKAHTEAQSALQQHEATLREWIGAADTATVAGGLWAQRVDQYADSLAKANPAVAAGVLAARNSGDTERELTAIMAAETLTRDEAIAQIQAEAGARQGHAAAIRLEGQAALDKIAELEGEAQATRAYTSAVAGLTQEERAHYDAARQVLGAEEALRQLREVHSGLSINAPDFFGLGASFGQGLAGGVASTGPNLRGAVTSVIDRALLDAQGRYGIHSPSTWTAERIGRPLMQGVAAGAAAEAAQTAEGLAHTLLQAVSGLDPTTAAAQAGETAGTAWAEAAQQAAAETWSPERVLQEAQRAREAQTALPGTYATTGEARKDHAGGVGLGIDTTGADIDPARYKALDQAAASLADTVDKLTPPLEKVKSALDDLGQTTDAMSPSTPAMIEDVARRLEQGGAILAQTLSHLPGGSQWDVGLTMPSGAQGAPTIVHGRTDVGAVVQQAAGEELGPGPASKGQLSDDAAAIVQALQADLQAQRDYAGNRPAPPAPPLFVTAQARQAQAQAAQAQQQAASALQAAQQLAAQAPQQPSLRQQLETREAGHPVAPAITTNQINEALLHAQALQNEAGRLREAAEDQVAVATYTLRSVSLQDANLAAGAQRVAQLAAGLTPLDLQPARPDTRTAEENQAILEAVQARQRGNQDLFASRPGLVPGGTERPAEPRLTATELQQYGEQLGGFMATGFQTAMGRRAGSGDGLPAAGRFGVPGPALSGLGNPPERGDLGSLTETLQRLPAAFYTAAVEATRAVTQPPRTAGVYPGFGPGGTTLNAPVTPGEVGASQLLSQNAIAQGQREYTGPLPATAEIAQAWIQQGRDEAARQAVGEKARSEQADVGLTPAQREARRMGVPSYQSILDADRQQAAQRQLDHLTQGLSLAARASVEFTVQTRGAEAALESLGGNVDVNAPEAAAAQQAAGAQARGSLQDLAQQAAALTAGSDVVAAAAARAGVAAAAQAAVGGDVAKAAQQASEVARAEWSVVIKEAGALLKGELVSAFGPIPATQLQGGGDQPALYASALQPGTSTLRTVGGEPAAQAVQIIINNPTFQNAGVDQVRAWRQAARAVR